MSTFLFFFFNKIKLYIPQKAYKHSQLDYIDNKVPIRDHFWLYVHWNEEETRLNWHRVPVLPPPSLTQCGTTILDDCISQIV